MVNKWLLVDPPLFPKIMYISCWNPYDNSTLEKTRSIGLGEYTVTRVHHKVLSKFNKKIQQGNRNMYTYRVASSLGSIPIM